MLGLDFKKLKKKIIPNEIIKLIEEHEKARSNKDFKRSDELRDQINLLGYETNNK